MYGEGLSDSTVFITLGAAMLFLFIFAGGAEGLINAIKKRWGNSSFITKRLLTWIAIPIYIFAVIYVFIPR